MNPAALSGSLLQSLLRSYQWLRPKAGSGASGTRPDNSITGRQKSNRAAAADLLPFQDAFGLGEGRARTELGGYYTSSVSVYSAVKLRADAVSRPATRVFHTTPDGSRQPVDPSHPVRQLLERVNPWASRSDLWRATEVYLNLWGAAFWALERDEAGRREIWPLRPDRVSVVPDRRQYVRGFVYQGRNGTVAYTPDEMVWLRYFHPLEEYAGLSPLAPSRLSVDTGNDGMRFNRSFFRNSAQPDFVLLTHENMTDAEVEDFYHRWESRYQGAGRAHRPAIANFISDIKTLEFKTLTPTFSHSRSPCESGRPAGLAPGRDLRPSPEERPFPSRPPAR